MKYILVNYNFIPDWIFDYTDDFLIYDRSDSKEYLKNFPQEKIIYTENIGNVDYDKLQYLIDNYDNLPDIFLLSKTNLFKYITKDEYDALKDNKSFTPILTKNHKVYEPICRYTDGIYEEINNSWYVPQFEHQFLNYNEWADYFGFPTPRYLKFAPGGSYILTKNDIHKYPKILYERLRDSLGYTKLPAEAQFMERTYYTLWK